MSLMITSMHGEGHGCQGLGSGVGSVTGRACEVGADVVDDDEGARQQEPDQAVEDVGHEEAGGDEDHQQDHVRPGELAKLPQVVPLLQRQHKVDDACRPGSIHPSGNCTQSEVSHTTAAIEVVLCHVTSAAR